MPSVQETRPRSRSSFAAAVLSLLFPGLGHAYAGAGVRALAFGAGPLLLVALTAGIVTRVDKLALAGLAVQAWFLTLVFVLNLVALAYRAAAIVDSWRVAQFLNAHDRSAAAATPAGGPARGSLRPSALSVAGLLAVLVVMSGAHLAVARYDMLASSLVSCVFSAGGTALCPEPTPAPVTAASVDPAATRRAAEGSAIPNATIPPWNGKDRLNILLIGSDASPNEGSNNTDTLIVASIDPASRRVVLFSLPRDVVDVPIPAGPARNVFGSLYRGKINSFYAAVAGRSDLFPGTAATRGYNGVKAILGELYGLTIQYFAEVNFDGFVRIVDALGGVNVNVQVPVVDDSYPTGGADLMRVYIPAGMRHMTGAEALIYARSRHGSSDFDRAQRQQRILVSLRDQVDVGSLLPRIDELAVALGGAIRTDIPRDIVPQLLGLAGSIDARAIRSYVFAPPLYGTEVGDSPRGYIVEPKVAQIRTAVKNAFTEDPGQQAAREGLAAEGARIWVLPGASRAPSASNIADYLQYLGMNASAPGQKAATTSATKTVVSVYNGAEVRLPQTVQALEALFGVVSVTAADTTGQVDIVITTGSETPALTPPPAP